jgi:aspartyl-tRNA(Asn)/glutamyl-tRNA(Gln) amidotransferase subunit C
MPISRAEVEHVARLAQLGLTPDEIEEMTEQLSSVLEHIAKLDQVEVADVPPTAQAIPRANVMRDDTVQPSWPPEATLANAPHTADDFFEVQAIFD